MRLKSPSLSLRLKGQNTGNKKDSGSSSSTPPESGQEVKLKEPKHHELSLELRRMYNSEQLMNFRHIYRILATKSDYTLTEKDIAPPCINIFANAMGQFTELAWGKISAPFVWGHLEELSQEGYPLDRRIYDALLGSVLVDSFYGTVASVHAYVIYRKHQASYEQEDQLVLCFSGTDGPHQALLDIKTNYHRYKHRREDGCLVKTDLIVHAGFWRMYKGVRVKMQKALRHALERYPKTKEIVIGGHSLGGALAYLSFLDLLQDEHLSSLFDGKRLIIATFGAPRVGNQALVNYWKQLVLRHSKKHGRLSLQEVSVKAYNDGVPTLPMTFLGFRHFSDRPFYLYSGMLFEIPPSEKEHSYFPVKLSPPYASSSSTHSSQPATSSRSHFSSHSSMTTTAATSTAPANYQPSTILHYPRGGHNYYGRDFEKLGRSMEWIDAVSKGEKDWEKRYIKKREKWDKKWSKKIKD